MNSAFVIDKDGVPYIEADPDSELDYSVLSWLEGLLFQSAVWSVTPNGPVLYNQQINGGDVTFGGVTYSAGQVASTWIKTLTAGVTYTVTLHATFDGGRIDDRSFEIRCKQR